MLTRGSLKDAATSGGFWLSWLLPALGAVIGNPTAGFLLAFLAVTCAVLPLAFGSPRQRVGAAIALLLSLLLAFTLVQTAKNDPYFKQQRPAGSSGR